MSIYDYLIDFPPAIATTVAADEDAFLDKVGGNTLDCGSRFLYGFGYLCLGDLGLSSITLSTANSSKVQFKVSI